MSAARRTGEFTGRHMLLLVLAFFGVVIAVNAGMAVLASRTWTGLVVENTYVASQQFETRRLAHEAQVAAGWSQELVLEAGRAVLTVRDGKGEPVDLGEVTLKVNRPVGGQDDRTLALVRGPDGRYEAPIALPQGVWDAQVSAPATALGPFELRKRFTLQAGLP